MRVAAPASETGLTTREAAQRLDAVGPNTLPEPAARGLLSRVAEQLRDPMIVLLLVAAAITAGTGDVPDTVIITVVVVFNTVTGVLQQVRADRAVSELGRLTAPTALVHRDGAVTRLPSADVVPDDLVDVLAGDIVPADGVLVTAERVQVDQALITGESLPVDLAVGDDVPGGALLTRGRASLVVTRTGAASGVGRMASLMVTTRHRPTPLQRRLSRLSRLLVAVVLLLTSVVVAVGLAGGRSWEQMLVVGLSLAVAAVPESLPAVVTVALAVGARRMAQHNAVVRHLPAVETLGSVTVIATDKTGTVTEGAMVAEQVHTPTGGYRATGSGYAPQGTVEPVADTAADPDALRRLLRDVVLCNDARLELTDGRWNVVGDPLEGALLAVAEKAGQRSEDLRAAWPRVAEEPFDHLTRRMVTHHRGSDRSVTICKGAPESVLPLLEASPEVSAAATTATRLAELGHRVIAVADREAPELTLERTGLTLAGLVALTDPPRRHASAVVRACHDAGIRLLLVTGDHPGTAVAVARRVGITTETGGALLGEDLGAGPLGRGALSGVDVLARVRPEQKLEVVHALQRAGEVTAMIGDGVNDAPALKSADIGVAAGLGGSEVARQAADLVLMDDDLSTLVAAVAEGRRIIANIRAFLTFALSGGFAEVAVMVLGPLMGLPLPLLPGQILWINLVTHGLTGMAFSAEPADPGEMSRPPRPPAESILSRHARLLLTAATVALTVTSLAMALVQPGGDGRTALFVTLGLGQLGVALAVASRHAGGHRGRWTLRAAVAAAGLLMVLATVAPALRTLLGTEPVEPGAMCVLAGAAIVPGLLVAVLRRRVDERPRALGH